MIYDLWNCIRKVLKLNLLNAMGWRSNLRKKLIYYQLDEGKGLGSWISISLSQQTGFSLPAFVQRISVPHTWQRYLFPSWLIVSDLQRGFRFKKVISSAPSVRHSNKGSRFHHEWRWTLHHTFYRHISYQPDSPSFPSLEIKAAYTAPEASSLKPYPSHSEVKRQ